MLSIDATLSRDPQAGRNWLGATNDIMHIIAFGDIHMATRQASTIAAISEADLGGSNPTPFDTPFEFSEEELLALGERAMEQGREFITLADPLYHRAIPLVFVAHTPPFGTSVDRIHNGRHVGSTAVRAVIERYQPQFCITGHILEGKGHDRIGRTPIYNPGMFANGGHLAITVGDSHLRVLLQ